jgi:DNA-binding XRE family transcriptional regulator
MRHACRLRLVSYAAGLISRETFQRVGKFQRSRDDSAWAKVLDLFSKSCYFPYQMRARIRARRQELRLTQAEIAKLVRLSRCALSRWEVGKLRLSTATVDRIADALGLDTKGRARLRLKRHVEAARGALGIIVSERVEAMERKVS